MAGAMVRISGVGLMNTRIYRLGAAKLSAVQNSAKAAVVYRARRSVSRMRLPFPAP